MGNTQVAEYLIAALTVLAIVVTFRRKTPRALELAVWISLVWVCLLAITSTPNPQARALTSATAWGAGRIVGMVMDLSGQGVRQWMFDARFAIAGSVVILFALDMFALALVSTRRQANAWIPVTKLGEWMVLPGLRPVQPQRAAVSGVDELNLRLNVWAAAAASAAATWSTLFFMWLRDNEVPRAARGLKHMELGTVAAWRRVAAGRAQLGQVRISRVVLIPVKAVHTARSRRPVAARPAPLEPKIVAIDLLAKRAAARKAAAATTPRTSRRRTAPRVPQPPRRTNKNVSAKVRRQGRLAS